MQCGVSKLLVMVREIHNHIYIYIYSPNYWCLNCPKRNSRKMSRVLRKGRTWPGGLAHLTRSPSANLPHWWYCNQCLSIWDPTPGDFEGFSTQVMKVKLKSWILSLGNDKEYRETVASSFLEATCLGATGDHCCFDFQRPLDSRPCHGGRPQHTLTKRKMPKGSKKGST